MLNDSDAVLLLHDPGVGEILALESTQVWTWISTKPSSSIKDVDVVDTLKHAALPWSWPSALQACPVDLGWCI